MWNTVWESVSRFGTFVTQPNYLQYQNTADYYQNWRNLDWQEEMMWWAGTPILCNGLGILGRPTIHAFRNATDGTVPSGSGVATPPVNPVTPNWGQIGTGTRVRPLPSPSQRGWGYGWWWHWWWWNWRNWRDRDRRQWRRCNLRNGEH